MHISVIDSSSGSNLEEKLKSGVWIVLFYADWCGHCQQFKPEWERMKSLMPSNLNSAEIESSNISNMSNPPQVQGFPTIKMYRDNLNIGDYEGNRTAEAILKNLKSIKMTPKKPKVHSIEKKISKMTTTKPSPKPIRKLSQLLEAEGHKLKKLTKEASIFNYDDNENTSSKVIMEHLKKGLEQQEKLRNETMNNNTITKKTKKTKKQHKQQKQQKQQKTMMW